MVATLIITYPEGPMGEPTEYQLVPITDHFASWGNTEGCTFSPNAAGMSAALFSLQLPGSTEDPVPITVLTKHQNQIPATTKPRWVFWILVNNPIDFDKVYRLKITATKTAGGTITTSVDFKFVNSAKSVAPTGP